MRDNIIMIFKNNVTGISMDIEVPKTITANDLIYGLNKGLEMGININDASECYLCAKNPRVLVKGNKSLEELGLRNGTTIMYQGRR